MKVCTSLGVSPEKSPTMTLSPSKFPDLRVLLPLTLAARTNLIPLTAIGYESWRKRALSMLSGRSFPLEEELELLIQSVQPVQGSTVLDLGTSTGLYARALLGAGARKAYALDLSPAMLQVAIEKSRDLADFEPLLARAEAIPLSSETIDAVVVGGTWNEFPDPGTVVQEMYRVLKPGGRIFLMFTHRSSSPLQRLFEFAGLQFPTLEAIQSQLGKGFTLKAWRENSVGFVTGTKVRTDNYPHSDANRRP